MTPEQYAASQAAITAGLAAYVQRIASLFRGPSLSIKDWLGFLRVLFPEVEKKYAESAELGRRFYDSQRAIHHPDLDRNDRYLSELEWGWFVKNMEPVRKDMSLPDSPPQAASKAALVAVREVEMAGRRQVLGAVKNDPEPVLQGWARVATGRETCAWCLMMISRGAELNHKGNFAYQSARTGGINLDDNTVIDLWNESGMDYDKFREATKEYIEEWHAGCDCLVIPVFDINDWPGRASALRAQQLWIDAGKEADRLIKAGKSRTNNTNTETLNALRRRLERGDISMPTYALAA